MFRRDKGLKGKIPKWFKLIDKREFKIKKEFNHKDILRYNEDVDKNNRETKLLHGMKVMNQFFVSIRNSLKVRIIKEWAFT